MVQLSNIKRQLVDIVNEGSKFNDISHVNEDSVFNFNKYAREIKAFLGQHVDDRMIRERLEKIRQVSYEPDSMSIFHICTSLFLGTGVLIYKWQEYNKKVNSRSEILEIVSVFSSIEFLLRNRE